jgi:protein ImuB
VVLRVETLSDAQPERAVQLTPWTQAQARPSGAGASELESSLPPEQSRCRPVRLLSVPQPIAVVSVVPDGPPIRITWRARECRVVRSWGPERIETGWWRAPDVERDYYRAEYEDGTHAWIFRDRRGARWFLHGFFE